MYHVIGTGITAILLYLLSYFFYRNNFYSQKIHRKLWNIILASAFILTALAGLFLALQINYKWNIPVIKTILKWHVEFGIGLAVTGFFHLLWHFSYYTGIFKQNGALSNDKTIEPEGATNIATDLFIVGFISSSVQLLMLKEIMNISGGYELIAGTFLGSWLIGSAAGSWAASGAILSGRSRINLFFSLSPVISVVMMLLLARLYLKTGETPSLFSGIIFTFLTLIPFCFVSGFTFIRLISIARKSNIFVPGKSFSIETTGGIAAGVLISLPGSGALNTYRTLLLIIVLGISYAVLTFYLKKMRQKLFFKFSVLGLATFIILSSPDLFFRQLLLRGINVTSSKDTKFGNITIAEYGGETSTYYDQRLLTYSGDAAEREEDIHYAMLQIEKPETVLLVSGSVNSHLSEIVKYPVGKVVYVERDPALTEIEGTESPNTPELVFENEDAYTFIRRTTEKFDAAIVLLPPPSSLLLNRYYSYEFFSSLKKSMNPDGVFACSPGINPNYFNKEAVDFYSSIYNTLKAVFKNVIPVSGIKLYFIASDKDLSTSFCRLTLEKNIANIYVGPDYLSDDLTRSKSEEVTMLMDKNIKINMASVPVACFYYQAFSLSKNIKEMIPAVVLLVILFVLPVFTIKRSNLVMYFSASALAAFEIILLLVLQLTAGSMYRFTGLILAGIMAGLAVGTGMHPAAFKCSALLKTIFLAAFYFLMGISIEGILKIDGSSGIVILLVLAGFFPAVVTGTIFRDLTLPASGFSSPSNVYNADLTGSAIGFILFSGLIIPVLGIQTSLFILPLLIITGFLFALVRDKQ